MSTVYNVDSLVEVTESFDVEIVEVVKPQLVEILEINQRGLKGESAYQVALVNGFIGSQQDWLNSLSGHTPSSQELTSIILPLIPIGNDAFFTFEQISAQMIWIVNHNLNKYPSVSVVDSGGNTVTGDVNYMNLNKLTISFNAAFGGTAYLN